MSNKMDGYSSRTPADIERRFNFGKSFSEVMGVAKDAQNHALKAEEVAKSVEAKVLEINVVKDLNASADIITLNSNRLVVNSDKFSLSANGVITATEGKIAKWDISNKGISKIVGNVWVKIDAPETEADDFIAVATMTDGVVTTVPLNIKANGDVLSKGIFQSTNHNNSRSTIIDSGTITIDGEWYAYNEGFYFKMLLMKFTALDDIVYGVYASGQWDDNDPIIHWIGLTIEAVQ